MPFRSDEEILAMTMQAMGEAGSPRCLFVSALLPLVGLTDLEAAAVFFPNDTPAYQQAMGQAFAGGKTSSCGITTEVGWRAANVQDPLLDSSYFDRVNKGQYTVMRQKQFAEEVGAWVSAIPWVEGTPLPEFADAPIIGCTSCGEAWSRGTKNLEHEYNVVAYDPAGNGIHHSIDGGQPGIKFRTRALVEVWTGQLPDGRRTGELWASTVTDDGRIPIAADGRPITGRRFLGYTSVAKLPLGPPRVSCLVDSSGPAALVRKVPKGALVVGGAALLYLLSRLVSRWK